jgi:hypothetical protein
MKYLIIEIIIDLMEFIYKALSFIKISIRFKFGSITSNLINIIWD